MPIYDFACSNGHMAEALVPRYDTPAPPCPRCGGLTVRRPSGCSLGGIASPGPSRSEMPQTWAATHGANTEYVAQLRKQWDRRRQLEEKYPELRGDARPILAHEGQYEGAPLRLGDPSPPASGGPDRRGSL